MKARFVACDACHRHVKEGDAACPFCGAAPPRAEALPRARGIRMTRAAMIAAGTAGTVAAILDCGAGDSGGTSVFYGVACTGSECIGMAQDAAAFPEGGVSVFYGVACTGDACLSGMEDGAGSGDAGSVDASDATGMDASGVKDATRGGGDAGNE